MNTITNAQKTIYSDKGIAKALFERAANDPCFNAVCHVFALRERSRKQITLHSLKRTMKLEGFEFEAEQYKEVLKFLASLNIGKIELNRAGNVRKLSNIKQKLQNIGQMALGKVEVKPSTDKKPLKDFTMKLPKEVVLPKPRAIKVSPDTKAQLIVRVNGKEVIRDLNNEEVLTLLMDFYKSPR